MNLSTLRGELSAGPRTSAELVDECLSRIAELDPQLGAVLALNPQAGNDAEQADERFRTGEPVGPLHGIPILVKDVFETRGIRTTFGCQAFRRYVPEADAAAVRRLRAAGAIILGKTATPDFAMSWLSDSSVGGTTANSRSPAHEAGGSSAGSAVAVAAGLVPAALGSDTGGSVRIPASFNGVVGMRPTPGLVPTCGMSALVSIQDTPGPLTNSVDDAELLLSVLSGGRLSVSESRRPLETYRIGCMVRPESQSAWDGADQVSRVFDKAIARLGFPVDDVEVPGLEGLLRDSSPYLVTAQADLDAFLAPHGTSFATLYDKGVFPAGLDLADLLATRSPAGPPDRIQWLAARRTLRQTVVNLMTARGLDALVYPTVRVPAPRRDRDRQLLPSRHLPVNTLVASQADLPAVTLPAGTTDNGLPVGLELLGLPARDAALLRLARLVEQALGA